MFGTDQFHRPIPFDETGQFDENCPSIKHIQKLHPNTRAMKTPPHVWCSDKGCCHAATPACFCSRKGFRNPSIQLVILNRYNSRFFCCFVLRAVIMVGANGACAASREHAWPSVSSLLEVFVFTHSIRTPDRTLVTAPLPVSLAKSSMCRIR